MAIFQKKKEYLNIPKPTNTEAVCLRDMRICEEMYARGFEFMPIDLYRAKADRFQIIDGKIMPSFSSIDGMGETAAAQLAAIEFADRVMKAVFLLNVRNGTLIVF